ncbi:DUF2059 domain-containing protein [Sphaerospermopsis aphanizomenoides BCCUSP55]|uniref:DUF2059 domain-containing protein n=1 Tax=Sphaerospermopsis aphanizomenoides TaxID=459663 RepID=UPI0019038311|nr:DUF2059 domain-containing protein [Sphaerospermopsis aphanizomenoides]MBK1986533.1 DUF2059 domain-containing protein [Sphaerospermopsis aphanizomenoides BCCUSP55]
MKIQCLIQAVVVSLLTNINLPAFAQTSTQSPTSGNEIVADAQDTEKTNNIKKLLEITGTRNLTQQILKQMLNSMKAEYPQVPAKFWDTFAAELNPDDMIKEYIPVYSKYFTNEDIKGMIAFYQSPLGQKTLTLLPQISQDSTEIGMRYGRAAAQRAIEKLQSEGYIRNP